MAFGPTFIIFRYKEIKDMEMDINFTDENGNEFFIKVRTEEVQVWKNKTQITDVRFYTEELTEE